MKKLYTFLSAVIIGAVAVSAASSSRFTRNVQPIAGMEQLTLSTASNLPALQLSSKASAEVQAPARAQKISIKDPNEPVITGNYVVLSTSDEKGVEYTSFTSDITSKNDSLFLNNFIFGRESLSIPVKVSKEIVNGKGEYFMDIPGMSTLINDNGTEYKMFLYGPYGQNGAMGLFSKDISFYINPENKHLTPGYKNMGIVVGSLSAEGRVSAIAVIQNIEFCVPNALFNGGYYEYNSQTKEETVTPTNYDVYSEFVPEDKALVMFNFMGCPKPAVFLVQEEAKKVINDKLVLWTYTDYQTDPQAPKSYDFTFVTDLMNETPSTTSELTIASSKADKSVLTTPGCALFSYDLGPADIYVDVTVELPFQITTNEIDASGVENVTVSNSNAPVEYFNLQGVRVANPAAGELVIKRQGATVSKMVVR